MESSNVSLKLYSSLSIGGRGDMVVVSSLRDLFSAMMLAKREHKKIITLGEGTNVFFGDTFKSTLFVRNYMKGVSVFDEGDTVLVTACGGETFDEVVQFCVENGFWGIENLSLIPGTVGAAPIQNIGAYGRELADVFVSLSALDTETSNVVEIPKEACAFGYRDSLFKKTNHRYSIISVTLRLSKLATPLLNYAPLTELKNPTLKEIRECVISTRQAKLPDWKRFPNAGSFFKNPVVSKEEGEALRVSYKTLPLITHTDGYKIPAAWLIEHVAEIKGVRKGNVGTWPQQSLVLVNYGEETKAEELLKYSSEIAFKIKEKTGILLEREVNYISE